MKILKWPKKFKDKWRCQYSDAPKMPIDCIGFGFRGNDIVENGPLIFGWEKPDDIFVEMGNALNAMICCLEASEIFILDENKKRATVSYEQARDWYLLCVNELRIKLCPKCSSCLILERNTMNLNEALKQ